MAKEALSEFLKPFSQEHLIQFWDELSEADQEVLDHEIKQIDFEEITSHYSRVKSTIAEEAEEIDSAMKPVPYELKGSFAHSSAEQLEEYNLEGLKAISEGQVACLLMAGGQGTRLGVSYPKGMYSVKLQSDKTLYQIQAERLLRLEHLAAKNFPGTSGKITWYIMTSEHTQIMTGDFFKSNDFFGLQSSQIQFFEQGMLPCLTNEGKLILDAKNKISKAPDGNGGLYKALNKRKVLDDMEARGIQFIHVYGVDNILVKISDPVFIGFCIQKQANCAAKVVKKVDPEEKVGVICKVHEKFQVVEYSEISEKTRNLRDENGELTYSAGSICNHFFNAKFLSDLCRLHEKDLKLHVAEKKIPYVDESGERVEPKSPNGIKLEKFVFDVFPFSTNFAIWEVLREEEFSPLKNNLDAKSDNARTCKEDISNLHSRWLEKAGASLVEDYEVNDTRLECEISPLVSYSGEGLGDLVKGKTLNKPIHIELDVKTNKILLNGAELEQC